MRNPFRRRTTGSGFVLGDSGPEDLAAFAALADELNAARNDGERREIKRRIKARLEAGQPDQHGV